MLSYLVTSKARKALLQLLWKERASGSIQELAKAAGVSYAAAYNELSAMEKSGLASSRGEGRSVVFRANESHLQAETLRQLLDESPQMTATEAHNNDADVVANLKRFGAPLLSDAQPQSELSVEETLARALVLSHRNATILRALPLVLSRQASNIDFDALRNQASRLRQSRSLGFVLDVAATLSNNRQFKKTAASLHDKRVKHVENYFSNVSGRFAQEQARKNTPPLARRWRFVVNMPMDSFRAHYEKFVEVS